jgi:NADH:ubiquinone oxidoreductase subunit
MNIGTLLSLWLRYHYVGNDMFGNRYYIEKKAGPNGQVRRSVRYYGRTEATKVPPQWHAWLHYVTDKLPVTTPRTYGWQRQHVPNLTGTQLAFFPSGHPKQGGKRCKVASDYQAWKPSSN